MSERLLWRSEKGEIMSKNRVKAALATVGLVLAATLGGVVPASAASSGSEVRNQGVLDASDLAELESFFATYGVDSETASDLIAAFQGGVVWDSLGGDAVPISIDEFRLGSTWRTIETYSDGSIAVTSIDMPSDTSAGTGISPMGIYGCTKYRTGVPYRGCTGDFNLGVIRMGFMFNWDNRPGQVRVTPIKNTHFHRIIGGAATNHRVAQITATKARYSMDTSLIWQGFPIGTTIWVQVNVSSTDAWVTHN